MPRNYKRKTDRASWSQSNLIQAAEDVNNGRQTLWAAAKTYGIPYRTLKRRIVTSNLIKGEPGPSGCLGKENEASLVKYIQLYQESGFPLTGTAVRRLAYTFAEHKGIPHRFNNDNKLAGFDWLQLFMRRHPELTVRKAQGISIGRGLGMCRDEIDKYFSLLFTVLQENSFLANPRKIYNLDECGLQMNNEPGIVIAKKGSRDVHHVTSAEKGETITVVACCNAEGKFLPPYCIFKGKRKKAEFEDGMPPGSHVEMNETSAYINTEVFMNFLKNHFVPRKEPGKVLLILDGHASHCSDVAVLDFAAENDVIIFCLPSHTTQYLQPLDRSFFKPLKTYWRQALNSWIHNKPDRKLSRLQFGSLLNVAWSKAATVGNGTSGFSATGIYPYNLQAIPHHAFAISDGSSNDTAVASTSGACDMPTPAVASTSRASGSGLSPSVASTSTERGISCLEAISPIPQVRKRKPSGRKKQTSEVLTESERRRTMREKAREKLEKAGKGKTNKRKPSKQQKKKRRVSLSSSIEEIPLDTSGDSFDEDNNDDFCAVCKGYFYAKKGPKCDWIQCIECNKWLHEDCNDDHLH